MTTKVRWIVTITNVFVYNRAGYGDSEPSVNPRTGTHVVAELRSTLRAAEMTPPYVLVGHSLGGLYMMLYAKTYPDEVAGLVLVDATPYYPIAVCLERLSEDECTVEDSVLNHMPPHERAEALQIETTQRQVREAGPMPDIPVVFLVGPIRESVELTEYWLELQQEMASETPQSTLIVDPESGHHIHFDNPQLVIDAITGLLAQVAD